MSLYSGRRLVLIAMACIHYNALAQVDDNLDTIGSARTAVYAFRGAVEEHDWQYVVDHSSDEFIDVMTFEFIVLEGLFVNERLTAVVERHLDKGKLNSEEMRQRGSSTTYESIRESVRDLVVSKRKFVIECLEAVQSVPSQLPLPFRKPKAVGTFDVQENCACVELVLLSKHAVKEPNTEELAFYTEFSEYIYFRRINGNWLLSGHAEVKK